MWFAEDLATNIEQQLWDTKARMSLMSFVFVDGR